jgi:hypothetical protein
MPGAAKKKILIFGDSFSSQRGDALTVMLAETVRDVEFVWSSNLDWAFIKRAKRLVERFMTILAGRQAQHTPHHRPAMVEGAALALSSAAAGGARRAPGKARLTGAPLAAARLDKANRNSFC